METQVQKGAVAIGSGISSLSPRVLNILLQDKATGKNIVWATDNYIQRGDEYAASCEIFPELITGANSHIIQPRVRKDQAEQSSRTRKRGEVFTPLWVCQKMCDQFDAVWNAKTNWKQYVDARCLEITCGEAPFLVSRYDAASGEAVPLHERIGLLDRKLRVVDENAQDEAQWLEWALRAVESIFGYEYQGDSLLIARLNVLMTYGDYLSQRWRRQPTAKEQEKVANVIAWNLWQMDGLKNATPIGSLETRNFVQTTLFGDEDPDPGGPIARLCKFRCWRARKSYYLQDFSEGVRTMKFDFVIGNPPYQEEVEGTSDKPIYNYFMDAAYLTDEVYNTIQQTLTTGQTTSFGSAVKGCLNLRWDDKDGIKRGEQEKAQINAVLATLGTYPSYELTASEDGSAHLCCVRHSENYIAAVEHTKDFISGLKGLSDKEKIKRIAWYVCDRLAYDRTCYAWPSEVLTQDGVVRGACMSYAYSFQFLCQQAGIPCLLVSSATHQWNAVYVEGRWWEVDVTGNDCEGVSSTVVNTNGTVSQSLIPFDGTDAFREQYYVTADRVLWDRASQPHLGSTYTNIQPEVTRFAQELLVPGSTK